MSSSGLLAQKLADQTSNSLIGKTRLHGREVALKLSGVMIIAEPIKKRVLVETRRGIDYPPDYDCMRKSLQDFHNVAIESGERVRKEWRAPGR